MNIIACYKVVPEEQDITVASDRTLSFERAEWKIGQYDLNAIEAGMQLVEEAGGKVSALSVGSKELDNSKLKKGVLSRGPEDLFMVVDEGLSRADAHMTAQVLQAAIHKIGAFDVVVCGEGSSDLYAQQVGIQLGELLGVPTVNAISKISIQGDKLICERTLENEIEVMEVPMPVVISVTTDINVPRLPNMKSILAAGKKPVVQWSLADISLQSFLSPTRITSTLAPEQVERKQIILESDTDQNIATFFENIRRELL